MDRPERIYLDARDLEHPIPLEQAMRALRDLSEGNYFYMLHRKKPIPLIDLVTEQGFRVFVEEDTRHHWHILITRDPAINLREHCDV